MSLSTSRPSVNRTVRDRHADRTAPARCLCYAAWSELVASPHDVDPAATLAARRELGAVLPYAGDLDELVIELRAVPREQLQAEYSGLFEVGSEGPPAPIREDLQTGQKGGTREDIVRFYDFFGYVLEERFAWQPDHLSVELEFMHYLCFREAGEDADPLSFQLAQLDFAERHLVRWVPPFAARVAKFAPGSRYARVLGSLAAFLSADFEWQSGTVVPAAASG